MGEQYGIPFLGATILAFQLTQSLEATILHRGTQGLIRMDEYVSRSGLVEGQNGGGGGGKRDHIDALLCAQRFKRAYADLRRVQAQLLENLDHRVFAAVARDLGIAPHMVQSAIRGGRFDVGIVEEVLRTVGARGGVLKYSGERTFQGMKVAQNVVMLELMGTLGLRDELKQLVEESKRKGGSDEEAVRHVVCDYWRQTQDLTKQLRDMRTMLALEGSGDEVCGSVVEEEEGWDDHVGALRTHDADGGDHHDMRDGSLVELCRIFKLCDVPTKAVSRPVLIHAIQDRPEVYLSLGQEAKQAAMSLLEHHGPLSREDTQLLFDAPYQPPYAPKQTKLNDLASLAGMLSLSHESQAFSRGVIKRNACWRLLTMLQRHPCILRMHLKLRGTAVQDGGGLEPLRVTQAALAYARDCALERLRQSSGDHRSATRQ